MIAKTIQEDYICRINQVFSYIDTHLDQELSLETVAAVAHFSPFHFHRIFKIIANETLNVYISRKRIEKAASALIRRKNTSITELAFQYGFSSNAAFTRSFKNFYGISPTGFRRQSPDQYSKIRKEERKNGEEHVVFEQYLYSIKQLKHWTEMHAITEVKQIPELTVAYISHTGDLNMEATFEKLMQWAKPKGLMDTPDFNFMTMYHDSYKVTAPDKVRMSIGIVVKEPVAVSGEVGLMKISAGKYIVGRFEIPLDAFEKAWTSMFVWMNENGYKATDRPPFELYHNDFRTHPEKKFILDMYIPID